MTLPWWLAHFEPASLREVLLKFRNGGCFELGGRDARIADALLKNDYASGSVDVSRTRQELHVKVESGLLLEGGNTLLRSLDAIVTPIRSTENES